MKEVLIYVSQVAILTGCSYLIYKTAFSRDSFHLTKRFILLLMLLISFASPIFRITITKEVEAENASNEVVNNPSIVVTEFSEPEWQIIEYEAATVWLYVAVTIYLTGVVLLLAYRLSGVMRVKKLLKEAVKEYTRNGVRILLIPNNIPAFSFGNRIVMSVSDYNDSYGMIIEHEMVHVRQRHSADLLFINLALSLQWFNPFMWLIRRELVLTHEFAADQGVIQSGIDAKKYQYLLISKITCANGLIPVVNHFRSSDLRKRIMTMKLKSKKIARIKLLLILPMVSVVLVAFAETKYTASETKIEVKPEKEQFHMPYQGRIAVKYGVSSKIPGKRMIAHNGVDIIVFNDTVRAPYSGVVKYADFPKDGYGNKLVISHNEGLETTYAHLAKFLVAEGDAVKGGEPIAIVGNTGRTTSKHLHLECRINNDLVDPGLALPLSR